MTSWMAKWKMKGFQGIQNVDLWKRLDELSTTRELSWVLFLILSSEKKSFIYL